MLLPIVDFHQSDAAGVVFPAHDCGVGAGSKIRCDGRFAIVDRGQASVFDFGLLRVPRRVAVFRGYPTTTVWQEIVAEVPNWALTIP